MRKCIRCGAEMIEGLTLLTHDGMGISVAEKGLFKGSLSKLSAAACAECGYVESYMENTDKLDKVK